MNFTVNSRTSKRLMNWASFFFFFSVRKFPVCGLSKALTPFVECTGVTFSFNFPCPLTYRVSQNQTTDFIQEPMSLRFICLSFCLAFSLFYWLVISDSGCLTAAALDLKLKEAGTEQEKFSNRPEQNVKKKTQHSLSIPQTQLTVVFGKNLFWIWETRGRQCGRGGVTPHIPDTAAHPEPLKSNFPVALKATEICPLPPILRILRAADGLSPLGQVEMAWSLAPHKSPFPLLFGSMHFAPRTPKINAQYTVGSLITEHVPVPQL